MSIWVGIESRGDHIIFAGSLDFQISFLETKEPIKMSIARVGSMNNVHIQWNHEMPIS